MNTNRRRKKPPTAGFTLVELLVVIFIIVLVSAATLPVVIPAFNHRQVSEGARLLQATIAGARDAAIRANAPRGIRLMPDPSFPGGASPLAANRMIAIEPAADYTSGRLSIYANNFFTATAPAVPVPITVTQISVTEAVFSNPPTNTVPNEPTTWYWNIRQGDKIRFDDSGRYYTVAGPMNKGAYARDPNTGVLVPHNVERYVNYGAPAFLPNTSVAQTLTSNYPSVNNGGSLDPMSPTHLPEVLFLVNGQDDNGNGWVDEGFDGIDNDGDGVIDPGYNGLDDNGNNEIDEPIELIYSRPGFPPGGEYEPEQFLGSQLTTGFLSQRYTIFRRPVVSEGAREVALPQGVVIDMTTWNAGSAFLGTPNAPTAAPSSPERSRLPVDPYSYYVDVMIAPNGQVIPSGPGQGSISSGGSGSGGGAPSPTSNLPFYHFWVAEREDVFDPLFQSGDARGTAGVNNLGAPHANTNYNGSPPRRYLLPMPRNTAAYDVADPNASNWQGFDNPNGPFLKGDRRLVTLYVRTGQVVTNAIETFHGLDVNTPYYQAQFGTRESQ